jgi:hypothetical protein
VGVFSCLCNGSFVLDQETLMPCVCSELDSRPFTPFSMAVTKDTDWLIYKEYRPVQLMILEVQGQGATSARDLLTGGDSAKSLGGTRASLGRLSEHASSGLSSVLIKPLSLRGSTLMNSSNPDHLQRPCLQLPLADNFGRHTRPRQQKRHRNKATSPS